MVALLRDLRYALRALLRSPVYSAVAILTLALAIGATTALFSVVDGVLLRPLPYADPGRLVELWETSPNAPRMQVTYPDLIDWQQDSKNLQIAAARFESYTYRSGDRTTRLAGRMLSWSLLPTLGVAPALGRNFTPDEDRLESPPVVMLAWDFWQREFDHDPSVLGKTVVLSGLAYTIVGVLPADFRFDEKIDVYTPLGRLTTAMRHRGNRAGIYVIGRMAPGVTLAQAREDMAAVGAAIIAAHPEDKGVVPVVSMLQESESRDARSVVLLLMFAGCFVLLIALANVANLTLARGTHRARELAIRASLGASRGALVRQLLVESAVVGVIAGGLGALLATWAVDLLASARPESLPTDMLIRLDVRVLAFNAAISLVAGFLVGLLPALRTSQAGLSGALKDGAYGARGASQERARGGLVVIELALAVMLLVGAGLSIRALFALERTDLGFQPEAVLTAEVSLPDTSYTTIDEVFGVYGGLVQRLRAVNGIEAASVTLGLPILGAMGVRIRIAGRPTPERGEEPLSELYLVDEDYAKALGLRLIAGRFLERGDDGGEAGRIVIDDVLARQFPDGAIGQHISMGAISGLEIVGVVQHVVHNGLGVVEQAPFQIYATWRQLEHSDDTAHWFRSVKLAIRVHAGLDPESMVPRISAALSAVGQDLPLFSVLPLPRAVARSLAPRRFVMSILTGFASLALVLATVGLYSVMSYSVAQRQHEIGVRMALGATSAQILRLVLSRGLRLAAIGLLMGAAGAVALGRVMAATFVAVPAADLPTFVLVVLILLAAALLGCYLPARRATRVDPMVALRSE